mmetsp:Transcript_3197/g.9271  ORF Transcript_3197/g.9271 Transcript_3197/m.9271 type:complete len:96 (-) Transcript_3197:369-656(-)
MAAAEAVVAAVVEADAEGAVALGGAVVVAAQGAVAEAEEEEVEEAGAKPVVAEEAETNAAKGRVALAGRASRLLEGARMRAPGSGPCGGGEEAKK